MAIEKHFENQSVGLVKMSYTKNVQTLRGIIKNNASHLSLSQLNELIKIVDTWIKETPDIDDKGRFMVDRKITLSGLLMKLNFIRMEKEDSGLKTMQQDDFCAKSEGLN